MKNNEFDNLEGSRERVRPEDAAPLSGDAGRRVAELLREKAETTRELNRALEALRERTPHRLASGLAAVVTHAWRARARLTDGATGEPREATRRAGRHLESMFDAFERMGLAAEDPTGRPFDYGMPMTVVTTEPTPGLARERIIETIKPAVYWDGNLIQNAEVVVATPVSSASP